jgi:hypothetical protein
MTQVEEKPSRRPTLQADPEFAAVRAEALAMAERKRRQDALLDQALLETFPASDPVSVMRIT